MKPGDSLDVIYNEYVQFYKQYYYDDEYSPKDTVNLKGDKLDSKQWGKKRAEIFNLINKLI